MARKLFKKYCAIFPFIIFLCICFVIYSTHVSTDIVGGDIGDLVTAAYVAGVAHPPGYPLFVLLGHIFTMIPLPVEPVVKIGYISALSSIVALFFFYAIVLRLTKDRFVSFLTSSVLAFSYLFWFYSEIAEVFSLNTAIALSIFYFAYQFYLTKKFHFLYLLSLMLGLGLTNHHTIVLLLPSIMVLLLPHWKNIVKQKGKLLYVPMFFIAGLMPYLYVPLASSMRPVVNWQHVESFSDLFDLFTRRAYGTFSAGLFETPTFFESVTIFKNYWVSVISSVTLPVFIVGIVGCLQALFKKNYTVFFSVLLAFLFTGPIFNLYAGFPLLNAFIIGVAERFNILSSVFLLIAAALGLHFIKEYMQKMFSRKIYATIILSAFFIIPIMLFRYNNPKTDLSHSSLGTNLGKDYLVSLPPNAVLYATGDSTLFNVWYAHYALAFRPDVEVVQLGGLANSAFMDKQVATVAENNIIISELDTQASNAMLYVKKTRPSFFTGPYSFKSKHVQLVPVGLSLQIFDTKDVPTKNNYLKLSQTAWGKISLPFRSSLKIADTNLTSLNTVTLYAEALSRTGIFIYQQYKDNSLSLRYLNSAIDVDPNSSRAFAARGTVYFEGLKDCKKGEDDLVRAISINPVEKNFYLLLDLVYRNCYKDSARERTFRSNFKKRFGKEFLEAFPTVKN